MTELDTVILNKLVKDEDYGEEDLGDVNLGVELPEVAEERFGTAIDTVMVNKHVKHEDGRKLEEVDKELSESLKDSKIFGIVNPGIEFSEDVEEKFGQEMTADTGECEVKTVPENTQKISITQRILGISLIFACSILATTQGAILKYIKAIPTGEAVMFTAFHALTFFAVIVNFYGTPLRSFSFKKFVFMRCSLGGLGFLLKVWSFHNLPFGDATALIFTTPFFAGIIARFYLKEKYTIGHVIATICGFVGIVLIAKPTFLFKTSVETSDAPWWYVLVPLGTAAFMGWAYVCSRIAGKAVSPITISFYLAVCQLTGGVVYQTASKTEFVSASCFEERALLLVCGMLSVAIYLCLNKGLAIEKSATATLIRNCDTVMAYLVQIFIFKADVDVMCLTGAALIITGTASITLTKAFDITCGIEI